MRRANLLGYLCVLELLSREVKHAEERAKAEFKASSHAKLLCAMPGMGYILALTILSEVGDTSRFRGARKLSSYSGLCPATGQSGNTLRHGRITRQGSRWLRWALVEAAIHASSHPGPLRDYYLRLKRRKGNKVARNGRGQEDIHL